MWGAPLFSILLYLDTTKTCRSCSWDDFQVSGGSYSGWSHSFLIQDTHTFFFFSFHPLFLGKLSWHLSAEWEPNKFNFSSLIGSLPHLIKNNKKERDYFSAKDCHWQTMPSFAKSFGFYFMMLQYFHIPDGVTEEYLGNSLTEEGRWPINAYTISD